MKIYKLDVYSPLDMAGAGGDQDLLSSGTLGKGWFETHGIQVENDHILICATKEPILEWLPTYDQDYDPLTTGYVIEELDFTLRVTPVRLLTDEDRDRMTAEILEEFTDQSHGDGQCQDRASDELGDLDDAEFISIYNQITADDLED